MHQLRLLEVDVHSEVYRVTCVPVIGESEAIVEEKILAGSVTIAVKDFFTLQEGLSVVVH
jgi:hypothetical protein